MHKKLIEIPYDDWSSLRDLYCERKAESCGYHLIQILIEWAVKCSSIEIKLYSLNEQWREDGTFIGIITEFTGVFCNTLSDDLSNLMEALRFLDTKPFYRFFGFPERISPAIKDYFNFCGLSNEDFNPDGTFWYHISKEKAKNFVTDPPEGITVKAVDPSFHLKINSVWPHRGPGSEKFVKHLLTFNESVGAFDDSGNLIAWCLRLPIGSLGVLQVEESHKRKGLGNLLVRCFSKQLAERDNEVMAPVVYTNIPSQAMFEKLGFQRIDKVFWIEKRELV